MAEKRFKICTENFEGYELYKLTDGLTGESASILPFIGGSINGLTLKVDNDLVEIIDGYESIEDANANLTKSFKGSNLFPFPNRIADGVYSFLCKTYRLPVNFLAENNAIHGLVYDKAFQVQNKNDGDQGCFLKLKYNSTNCFEGYPFKYILEENYTLKENRGFGCTTTVTNLSDFEMPIGHGWHPYFKAGTNVIDDLELQFPAATMLEMDQRNIPTGKLKPYNEFEVQRKIGSTILDNCFRFDDFGEYVDILLYSKKREFGVKIRQEAGRNKYNFLQIYTPPDRKSIAIEPMTSAPDAFNNKEGLIILESGESLSFTVNIMRYDKKYKGE